MQPLEEKELKGITGKLLIAIIVQTAFFVATASGIYFTIKSDIRDLRTTNASNDRYTDLRFNQIQLQNSALQKQLEGIQIQLDEIKKTKH